MRPVMLHTHKREGEPFRHILCFPSGKKVRMQVTGENSGGDAEKMQVRVEGGTIMVKHSSAFQIADVLAWKSMTSPAETEGGFLLRAERCGACCVKGQQNGLRSPSAAPAEKDGGSAPKHEERVVAPVDNRPVVQEKAVSASVSSIRTGSSERFALVITSASGPPKEPSRRSV